MKPLLLTLLLLSACGPSRKDLVKINSLLEASKRSSCEDIREYLGMVQFEIQKQIYK